MMLCVCVSACVCVCLSFWTSLCESLFYAHTLHCHYQRHWWPSSRRVFCLVQSWSRSLLVRVCVCVCGIIACDPAGPHKLQEGIKFLSRFLMNIFLINNVPLKLGHHRESWVKDQIRLGVLYYFPSLIFSSLYLPCTCPSLPISPPFIVLSCSCVLSSLFMPPLLYL